MTFYYSLLEAITALNGAIPEDMIIDSSLVNVSTIIGQGLCTKSEPPFPG